MITGELNGREMPIEPNKEFNELSSDDIYDMLLNSGVFHVHGIDGTRAIIQNINNKSV